MSSLIRVTFEADLSGINAAFKRINDPKKQQRAIKKVAFGLLADVTKATPVDTGRARNGWNIKPESLMTYIIGNNVHYVPYLEFGTSRSRRHVGFIRRTISSWKPKGYEIIRKEMGL